MNYDPALSASVSSPGSAGHQFEYASAIDPALEASGPPQGVPANLFTQPGRPHFHGDLQREMQSASPSSGASDTLHL
jgi:hypothetical protein